MNNELNILVTNDDGINSLGIKTLINEMKKLGRVWVAAPDRQRSATSSYLSIEVPLRVKHYQIDDVEYFSVNGSPTDCAKLAISTLLPKKPDLLVAGINHGKNTSINVLYSGTIAAALEGKIAGIPSIAFSVASHNPNYDFSEYSNYIYELSKYILELNLEVLINVNLPKPGTKIKGIRLTDLSEARWIDAYEKRTDPFGHEYYWFAGHYNIPDNLNVKADDKAVDTGYISITPLDFNFYDGIVFDNLKPLENLNNFSNT